MADVTTLRIELDGRQARAEADKTGKSVKKLETTGRSLKKVFGTLGAAMVAGMAVRKFIDNTSEAQASVAQLNAVIKSTAGAAGKSQEELSAFADEMQRTTSYGDEAVESLQGILLTFTKIKGGTVDDATKVVLDMSTALGTSLKESAIQVGKALNDPILGVTALSRVGVQFSQDSRDVIRSLVETGRTAEAQTIILKELQTEFGGSAEAARDTFGGALANLKNVWNDLFEASSEATVGIVGAIDFMAKSLEVMGKVMGVVFGAIQRMAANAAVMWEEAKLAWMRFKSVWTVGEAQKRLTKEIDDQRRLIGFMKDAAADATKAIDDGSAAQSRLASSIEDTTTALGDQEAALKELEDAWGGVIDKMIEAIALQSVPALQYQWDMALQGRSQGMVSSVNNPSGGLGVSPIVGPVRDLSDASSDARDELLPLLDGFASLADGMGFLDENARQAVRSVSDIAGGLNSIRGGGFSALGGAGAIIGGIAGLAGLFGGNEDQRRAREANNRILEQNSQRLYEMTQALLGTSTTTQDLANVGTGAGALRDFIGEGSGREFVARLRGAFEGTADIFADLGLSAEQFNAIARELGIELYNSAGGLIPAALDQLIAATSGAIEQMERDAAEAAAAEAERAREKADAERRMNEALELSIANRRRLLGLEGDNLRTMELRIDQENELRAAIEAGYTQELIDQLKELQEQEMTALIYSFLEVRDRFDDTTEAAERAAAALAEYTANLEDDLAVRGLILAGDDKGAAWLEFLQGQEDEWQRAVDAGVGFSTLRDLSRIQQGERDKFYADLFAPVEEVARSVGNYNTAIKTQKKAVEDTNRVMQETARILNAPSGLRLSLLKWRASEFGAPSMDTNRAGVSIKEINVYPAKGESGEEVMRQIVAAGNQHVRAGGLNPFTNLSEDV